MTRAQTQQTLRQLPVKWAVALLALIVVYALAQPALNSRLGWNLPSLARLMGEPEPKKPVADQKPSATKSANSSTAANDDSSSSGNQTDEPTPDANASEQESPASADRSQQNTKPADASRANTVQPKSATNTSTKTASKSQSNPPATNQPSAPTKPKATDKAPPSDSKLLYGILKEVGRDRYVSIEGLQYNPGSEEGHRLKHLERHLKDMPDRPGKHGVFDGEMKDALKWIDDAYARGKRGAKGVRKSEEDNRTIYEVPFTQPIGYIGGRDGKRDGHPPARRIRLVVEGSKFITAFPF